LIFDDRLDAGARLAEALERFVADPCVVLAIPRGGVVVGEVVARALGAPLDVVVPRKIGAPSNPELGIGAIAPGVRVLDPRMIEMLGVTDDYLEREIETQEREIERRERAYRGMRPPLDVRGKIAIVVDDGVATGGTAIAALRWARAAGAEHVVLAVPVAPGRSMDRLRDEADEVVVLSAPDPFSAVGEWYRSFRQTSDREVIDALARSARSST
jgi:putative phosphoribosyl transferase